MSISIVMRRFTDLPMRDVYASRCCVEVTCQGHPYRSPCTEWKVHAMAYTTPTQCCSLPLEALPHGLEVRRSA